MESKFKLGDIVILKANGFGQTIVGRDNGAECWIIQEPAGPCRVVRDDEIEFDAED